MMKVITYGTAGSLPVCRPGRTVHGGNTTCLRILSDCIPKGELVGVDMGTGFYALCSDAMKNEKEVDKYTIFITHYHVDHLQGLPLVPQTYMRRIRMELIGPMDAGHGPREALEYVMKPPFHPVDSVSVKSHFSFTALDYPMGTVFLFHPKGGKRKMELEEFHRLEDKQAMIPFGEDKYSVNECLVVRMLKTTHPEQTISYRFEERPTGKVFVFLTDHENTVGVPTALKQHLQGADLLIGDAQYDRHTYDTRTAGFGHGTGDYVVRLAETCQVKRAGLTHHDPGSDDTDIFAILAEAEASITDHGDAGFAKLEVFTCKDLEVIEV